MPPFCFALPPLDFELPFDFDELAAVVEPSVFEPVPRAFAQRARAAAASLARVAGDIGRRRPSCFVPPAEAAGEEEDEEEDEDAYETVARDA